MSEHAEQYYSEEYGKGIMTDLLPCPFCGGEAELFNDQIHVEYPYVSCKKCNAAGPDSLTDNEAKYTWNTRAAITDIQFAKAIHDGRCLVVEDSTCGWWKDNTCRKVEAEEHALRTCEGCKHDSKEHSKEPCIYCNRSYGNWYEKVDE